MSPTDYVFKLGNKKLKPFHPTSEDVGFPGLKRLKDLVKVLQSPEPQKRLAALHKFGNTELCATIALGSQYEDMRKAAIDKISDLSSSEKAVGKKIELLKATGVPKKYWSELESMKITIA